MTGSTPADLAVTFRSLARRLREALEGREPTGATVGPVAELHSVVAAAAAELGVPGPSGADLAPAGDAIATAIERISADEWDDARLDRLRQLALDAGRLLRTIASLTAADG